MGLMGIELDVRMSIVPVAENTTNKIYVHRTTINMTV
jgi:hypothetical protein